MKRTIYGVSVCIVFLILTMGLDNYFGLEVKRISIPVFFAWTVQTVSGNWKELKEFLKKGLYNLK